MSAEHTPGPVAWQKHGGEWHLVGQYGNRPIVLTANHGHGLMLRDLERGVLVPLDPAHPDAQHIERAFNGYDELVAACKQALAEFKILGQALGERTPPEMVAAWDRVEAAVAEAEGR